MKIFDRRPLSLILCIMLGAFLISSIYDHWLVRITLILLAIILFISTFISYFKSKLPTALIRVISISSIIAVLFSSVYFDIWFKAYERYEGYVTIYGRIEDFETLNGSSEIILKTTNIDDTPLSEYKLLVYVDNDKFYGFSIGSEIEIVGKIDNFTSRENFDARSYYTSRGISGTVNEVVDFSLKDVGDYPITYKIKDLRESICRRIINSSNADTGGLLCAFLLGEKAFLPTGTKLDFLRTGLSHMLALSGMNLVILFTGLSAFLTFCGVGKKKTTLINIFFTLFYITLTGLSLSVVRAGFMLIVSSILFLLGSSRDSMTSLFVSVTLICIIEPYAVFDLSLWLSAFATLGIVVLGEYQSEKYSKPSFLKWLTTSLLASFFAIAATFAITTLKFDGASLVAAITTLLFSVIGEIFTYAGILVFIFGDFLLIKYPFILIGNFIIESSAILSDLDWIYVSTNFAVIEVLSIVFSVLFFAFFILEVKHKKIAISALLGMLGAIFSLSAILTFANQSNDSIIYYNSEHEHIVFIEDGEILAVDIASYSKGTAYSLYADIANDNITKIDKYVVTNYSYYLENAIDTLTDAILVRELYLPAPQNITEERIFRGILKNSEKSDLKIIPYFNEDIITIGSVAVVPLYTYALGESDDVMFTIMKNGKVCTYLTDGMLEGERKNMASEIIAGSHTIILGRHKSEDSNFEFSQIFSNLEEIISSGEKIDIDKETLNFYFGNGTKITFPKRKYALYVE